VRESPADRAGVLLDPGAAGLEEGAPRAVRVVVVVMVKRRGLGPVRGRVGPVLERPGGVGVGGGVALAETSLSTSGRRRSRRGYGWNGGPLGEAGLHRLQERAPRPVSFRASSLRMRVLVSHAVHSMRPLKCAELDGVVWFFSLRGGHRMSLKKRCHRLARNANETLFVLGSQTTRVKM
jgi:hypothetical protein